MLLDAEGFTQKPAANVSPRQGDVKTLAICD
jgi:hypothetical protein